MAEERRYCKQCGIPLTRHEACAERCSICMEEQHRAKEGKKC